MGRMFFVPRNIGWEHIIVGTCAIVVSSIAGTLINNKLFYKSPDTKKCEKSEKK